MSKRFQVAVGLFGVHHIKDWETDKGYDVTQIGEAQKVADLLNQQAEEIQRLRVAFAWCAAQIRFLDDNS